jgi:hypothetical protein
MRHNQTEKMEIIRVVESSPLGVKRTLRELELNRSTFYDWYRRGILRVVLMLWQSSPRTVSGSGTPFLPG